MSARLGLRYESPSSATACTTSAARDASDSASWRWRRSGRPLTSLPPMSRPAQTARLESSSDAVPAARLVIQKKCSGSMRAAQDWWVVTVEPALESSEELELESSVESVESW